MFCYFVVEKSKIRYKYLRAYWSLEDCVELETNLQNLHHTSINRKGNWTYVQSRSKRKANSRLAAPLWQQIWKELSFHVILKLVCKLAAQIEPISRDFTLGRHRITG